MSNELYNRLSKLLDYMDNEGDDGVISHAHIADEVEACMYMADDLELTEVRCSRCDKRFRSLPDVKYCTKECELGGVEMPYQTRALQQYHLLKAERGKA